jgi:4-amino-4-deoxy-L-arabinose transferase-like glycosyltransferase
MPKKYLILFALILGVYITNLLIDVMAVDAAQYAEMSWEMLKTQSFFKITCLGKDYLDKPPLLFWLNSLSFYLFGISNFSYKLPSLLFAILAIYSTYRFTRLYYTASTAFYASLMLASTEAMFLITNDVRTDTILMGSVIFAIWQLSEFFETGRENFLLSGCVGIGLALLAKGPIGLIAVLFAVIPQAVYSNRLSTIFCRYLIGGLGIIFLLLLPMCIGLYQQWGAAGLKFYFWTQSFGRITGESTWNNNPDPFFLVHTTLWAFLPWSLFLFAGWGKAIFLFIKSLRSKTFVKEIASLFGFTLVLIALMLSRYQLPHYVYIIYPLAAVLSANMYSELSPVFKSFKFISAIQYIICIAMIALAFILQYCFYRLDLGIGSGIILFFMAAFLFSIWLNRHKNKEVNTKEKLFLISICMMIAFNFLLSAFYFPALLKYQPTNDFGRCIYKLKMSNKNYVTYLCGLDHAGIFYAQDTPVASLWGIQELKQLLSEKKGLIIMTSSEGLESLKTEKIGYKMISERASFRVSTLTLSFLNPLTRDKVCSKLYLLDVSAPTVSQK